MALLYGRHVREGLLEPSAQHALAHRSPVMVEYTVDAGSAPAGSAGGEHMQCGLSSAIEAHEALRVVQLQRKAPCMPHASIANQLVA